MESAAVGGDILPKGSVLGSGDGSPIPSGRDRINTDAIDATRGSGSGDGPGDGSSSSDGPKRRGRKPGSVNRTKATTQVPVDLSGLAGILIGFHGLVADMTANPELVIGQTEADTLQKSIARVASHYGMTASQKAVDHAALIMALGSIYGPRLVVISMRKKAEKRQAAAPKAAPSFGVVTGGIIPNG